MAKTILQGTVKGKERRGGQKKWEDSITEGTGMDFASSTRAAKHRTKWKWKGVVADSSVGPTVMGQNRRDNRSLIWAMLYSPPRQ